MTSYKKVSSKIHYRETITKTPLYFYSNNIFFLHMDPAIPNLGQALTALDLEDQFLANGELAHFSLVERGRIANDIIAEKLSRGKWQSVIRMVYGGLGKADALFEGDPAQLREHIVASAVAEKPEYISESVLDILHEKREDDLLFQFATKIDLHYESLEDVVGRIHRTYFDDPVEGQKRKRALDQVVGKKALQSQDFAEAFERLHAIGDLEGIDSLFTTVLSQSDSYNKKNILERIALGDEGKREERLRRVVLGCLEGEVRAFESFEIYTKYPEIRFAPEEREAVRNFFAAEISVYDLKRLVEDKDPALSLLWAEKHATSDPKSAYTLFLKLGYDGPQIVPAVLSGLKMRMKKHDASEALRVREIQDDDLRRAYADAPFPIQIDIALHLQNLKQLKSLSKIAYTKGDLKAAYRLLVYAQANLEGPHATKIRAKLIENELKDTSAPWLSFLDPSDSKGKMQAYEALMEDGSKRRKERVAYTRFERAYRLAYSLQDEEKTQKAREHMVAISPRLALADFRKENVDEKGVDYVTEIIAHHYGTDQEKLKHYIEKYKKT